MWAASLVVLACRAVPVGGLSLPEGFVDDGYFDPQTFDWWGGRLNRTAEDGYRRELEEAGWESPRGHRRLDRLDCNNPDCACYDFSDDEDCGPDKDKCPCCITCTDLEYCTVLGGFKIEDRYYPTESEIKGSCREFDDRAKRLSNNIFGQDKTFRDTDECKDLVREYLCLWWGSRNTQYDNRCSNGLSVYKPCRSFCVQVGMMCANNPDWLDLCYNIMCPPVGTPDCEPGPVVVTDFECVVYQYESAWINGALSSWGNPKSPVLAVSLAVLMAMLWEQRP